MDDHTVMRSALAGFLSNVPDFIIHFEAGSKDEFKAKIGWPTKPDIILMDYALGEDVGVDCILFARENLGEDIGIIGLSMHKEAHIIDEVIQWMIYLRII